MNRRGGKKYVERIMAYPRTMVSTMSIITHGVMVYDWGRIPYDLQLSVGQR